MLELNLPWLHIAIVLPLVGALATTWMSDAEVVWRRALVTTGLVLVVTMIAWAQYELSGAAVAVDRWDPMQNLLGPDSILMDEINAPLLPLAALLYFLVTLATVRTKVQRFPFAWNMVSLSLLLALLACVNPWAIAVLAVLQVIPRLIELHLRHRSTRVFGLHMGVFAVCIFSGVALIQKGSPAGTQVGAALLAAAVLIRSGVVPVHCWMTDLFENASLGTALLFVTPMSGAYVAVRLLLPTSPDWVLQTIAILSLVTALYAACMALVQQEMRRFFCYVFLSNASLVLVGLEVASPTSLTGSLALWLSVGISLAGLGLTLRAIESRSGRLSLRDYHGLYEHMPALAVFFLLTALASIGFPGTIGFVGAELLVDGVVQYTPLVGMLVVLTGAISGIAALRAYFRLFTGTRHTTSVSLEARWTEKVAVLAMTALILGGGLLPQPGIASRYRAAAEIFRQRQEVQAQLGRPSLDYLAIKVAEATHE